MTGYAELQVTTNFSFLRGGSHPGELVHRAAESGLAAISVTDRNNFAGIVRAHLAAEAAGLPLVVGVRLDLADGPSLLAWPRDRAAYGCLCRLLTDGKMRAPKGECRLTLAEALAHTKGSILAVVPPATLTGDFAATLVKLAETRPDLYVAASYLYQGNDRARLARLDALARRAGLRLLATGDVLYHTPERRPLQDVLTCIREGVTLEGAGFRLAPNAERHIKPPEEMARYFKGFEHALQASLEIAEACRFSLSELRYEYPDEPVPPGKTPQGHLEDLVWAGAARRYPAGLSDKVRDTLIRELALIAELDYAPYFLTIHDIVAYAQTPQPDNGRHDPILCQGRGSAANSSVCYCLGITAVDPAEIDLLFERFLTRERREPPDIDVDFEHERREEVIQHIYARYGRHRAGLTATLICYRPRSAVREVGKVFALTEDVTSALAGTVWGPHGKELDAARIAEAGLDPADPVLGQVIRLTDALIGFPRHLSQHVGGFVLSRLPLSETVPIGNAAMADRTFIEWDKDDIEALGLMKVDVLGLGMLTCIRRAFDLLDRHYGVRHDLASVPLTDDGVYAMIQRADTLGVFQIESRAQMSMLPRLKPREFYDLVIEVAIVRPGPIQGDMVHPYLRRRNGEEPVVFPSPDPAHGLPDELERILAKTMGVPLFQEQAMRIAMVAAEFTPSELNELRHAMATFRRRGTIHRLEQRMVDRMIARGYTPAFAKGCFDQIKGFGEYGFPESHAASFARLVWVSCWLKHHYPAAFACALLNAQPMGFYAPAQIVRDAREHGVEVRPVDVNHSEWDCTLEPGAAGMALRLGLRRVAGLPEEAARTLAAARDVPFATVEMLHRRTGLGAAEVEKLAEADAFRSLGLDRRQALWRARGLARRVELPLFAAADAPEAAEPEARLPEMAEGEHVVADYRALRLSLKAHPMAFLRAEVAQAGAVTTTALRRMDHGRTATCAGVVLVRQRPGTAKGVVFMTIEDETGSANIIVWRKVLERHRPVVMGARLVLVRGRVQSQHGVMHLVADRLEDRTILLSRLSEEEARPPHARADEAARPVHERASQEAGWRHPRDVRLLPPSRDFR